MQIDSVLPADAERVLLGLPVESAKALSMEARFALLNTEALHVGELVAAGYLPERRAVLGMLRHAATLRFFDADAAFGSLSVREVVEALLEAAMGRAIAPGVASATGDVLSWCERVARAIRGRKEDTLADASEAVGQHVRSQCLDAFDAHAELMRAAERCGVPMRTASRIIADGIDRAHLAGASGGSDA